MHLDSNLLFSQPNEHTSENEQINLEPITETAIYMTLVHRYYMYVIRRM